MDKGPVDELRQALDAKTRERNCFCDALMAVLCASSLEHAKRIARAAFRSTSAIPARETKRQTP